MSQMSAEEKEKIISALQEKGATLPCPRCGHKNFSLLDGSFKQIIQHDFKMIALSGPMIPFIMAVCTNCGYMSQHALGALGLLPKDKEVK